MSIWHSIEKPTLVLDSDTARRNIHRMCEKAKAQKIRFRPHFKTHQSAEIGEWFREEGVQAITVSSLDMAKYFAQHGWQDITVAFPVNIRQMNTIQELARQIHLALLIESSETAQALGKYLKSPVDIWIKIDTGAGRTGIIWEQFSKVATLIKQIQRFPNLNLRGLLTHAGHTYIPSREEIVNRYHEAIDRLNQLRKELEGYCPLEVSVGDTPGCTLAENLGKVDEIRPGNFVFYDAMQLHYGVCQPEDIAVALACPVVAKHPERDEIVIHGGAIHLSKDYIQNGGQIIYGLVALPKENHWSKPLSNAFVRGLSQEHGIVRLSATDVEHIQLGDLICIIPVHSCLTVHAMGKYLTLDGKIIQAMNKE